MPDGRKCTTSPFFAIDPQPIAGIDLGHASQGRHQLLRKASSCWNRAHEGRALVCCDVLQPVAGGGFEREGCSDLRERLALADDLAESAEDGQHRISRGKGRKPAVATPDVGAQQDAAIRFEPNNSLRPGTGGFSHAFDDVRRTDTGAKDFGEGTGRLKG